jgi:hypothetical protein
MQVKAADNDPINLSNRGVAPMPVSVIAAIVAIFAAFAAALAWAQFHARRTDSPPAHAGLMIRPKRRPL